MHTGVQWDDVKEGNRLEDLGSRQDWSVMSRIQRRVINTSEDDNETSDCVNFGEILEQVWNSWLVEQDPTAW